MSSFLNLRGDDDPLTVIDEGGVVGGRITPAEAVGTGKKIQLFFVLIFVTETSAESASTYKYTERKANVVV
jgi:hypothetical protein